MRPEGTRFIQWRYRNSSLLISAQAMSNQSSRLLMGEGFSPGFDFGPRLPMGPERNAGGLIAPALGGAGFVAPELVAAVALAIELVGLDLAAGEFVVGLGGGAAARRAVWLTP